ncbi:ABC transporter, permease protein [Lactobacillus crispatus]|nr:ABC transporter, permease protein [Lactobacillus crispatus]
MCFFVQTNHTRKELLFLMFKEINLRNHSSLHKLFYSLENAQLDYAWLEDGTNKPFSIKIKQLSKDK